MELKNIDRLPQEVQNNLLPFLRNFCDMHSANIRSIFVYGSATGKNFVPKKSDINLAVVVHKIDRELLDKSLKAVALASRRRVQAPLILTKEHIVSSLDVFPVEFLGMQENHVLIYGEDILSDLVIEGEYIRLFCEQQVKGKLIRIRQAYLEFGLKTKGVEALLKESLTALIPIFRRLIGLKGLDVPLDKVELFEKMREAFDMDTSSMVEIWRDQRNDERIGGKAVREVFAHYIAQLETLAQRVDEL